MRPDPDQLVRLPLGQRDRHQHGHHLRRRAHLQLGRVGRAVGPTTVLLCSSTAESRCPVAPASWATAQRAGRVQPEAGGEHGLPHEVAQRVGPTGHPAALAHRRPQRGLRDPQHLDRAGGPRPALTPPPRVGAPRSPLCRAWPRRSPRGMGPQCQTQRCQTPPSLPPRFPRPVRPGDRIGVTSPSAGAPARPPRASTSVSPGSATRLRGRGGGVHGRDRTHLGPGRAAGGRAHPDARRPRHRVRGAALGWGDGDRPVDLLDWERSPRPSRRGSSATRTCRRCWSRHDPPRLGDHPRRQPGDAPYEVPDGLLHWLDLVSGEGPSSSATPGWSPTGCASGRPPRDEWKQAEGAVGGPRRRQLDVNGRLIGGCIETIAHVAGTPYGDVRAWAEGLDEPTIVYVEACEDHAVDIVAASTACGSPGGSTAPRPCSSGARTRRTTRPDPARGGGRSAGATRPPGSGTWRSGTCRPTCRWSTGRWPGSWSTVRRARSRSTCADPPQGWPVSWARGRVGGMSDPKQKLTSDGGPRSGLEDWRHLLTGIRARFRTGDFATGLALVDRIGAAAEEAGHHPDISLTYSEVIVTLSSHDVGGITSRDIDLARRSAGSPPRLGATADVSGLTKLEPGLDTPAAEHARGLLRRAARRRRGATGSRSIPADRCRGCGSRVPAKQRGPYCPPRTPSSGGTSTCGCPTTRASAGSRQCSTPAERW